MSECLNCCEEIEEGKEVIDSNGNCFCCQEHLIKYWEGEGY